VIKHSSNRSCFQTNQLSAGFCCKFVNKASFVAIRFYTNCARVLLSSMQTVLQVNAKLLGGRDDFCERNPKALDFSLIFLFWPFRAGMSNPASVSNSAPKFSSDHN